MASGRSDLDSQAPPQEEWKDRTEADAAIEWEATVTEVTRAAGAQRWDDDEIKRLFADIGPADGAWVSEHETVPALVLGASQRSPRLNASAGGYTTTT